MAGRSGYRSVDFLDAIGEYFLLWVLAGYNNLLQDVILSALSSR